MNNSDYFYENSRFLRNAEMYIDEEGKIRVARFTLARIEQSTSDSYFTVTSAYEYRLDAISLEFYGNVNLGWVIALANNKSNSLLEWPVSGDILRIPAYETVQRYV